MGSGDFAVYGSWDALIGFARELQRVFQIFIEANLRDHAGREGKTISMAIALANDRSIACRGVWRIGRTCSKLRKQEDGIRFMFWVAFSNGSNWPTPLKPNR